MLSIDILFISQEFSLKFPFIGNAIRYCKHVIYVESDLAFADFQDRLLSCDKRLRQLSKLPLTDGSPTFPSKFP